MRYWCSNDVFRFKGILLCSKQDFYVQRETIVDFQCSDSCMLSATIGISYVQMTFSKFKGTFLCPKGYFMFKGELSHFHVFQLTHAFCWKRLAQCQNFGRMLNSRNLAKIWHFAKLIPNKTPAWVRWFEKPSQLWATVCLCKMFRNNLKEMKSASRFLKDNLDVF